MLRVVPSGDHHRELGHSVPAAGSVLPLQLLQARLLAGECLSLMVWACRAGLPRHTLTCGFATCVGGVHGPHHQENAVVQVPICWRQADCTQVRAR
jgi:hypothetical protein